MDTNGSLLTPANKRTKTSRYKIEENINGWLFLSLSLIGFLLFRFIPIVFSFIIGFCNWNLVSGLKGVKWAGLSNFAAQWSDKWFIDSLINTFIYAFLSVPGAVFLSLMLAIVLNGKIFGRSIMRLMFYSPYVSSMVAVSIIWAILYSPDFGPINMFLKHVGFTDPPRWLASSKWALISLVIMSIWQVLGYNMVIFLAGLQNIPSIYYEAALIDGANSFQQFKHITLPMLSPTTFFILITSIIGSFQVFAQVNIMTHGGPGTATTVLVYYIYNSAFKFNKLGYANSIAMILFAIIFIFTMIQWKFQDKWVYEY